MTRREQIIKLAATVLAIALAIGIFASILGVAGYLFSMAARESKNEIVAEKNEIVAEKTETVAEDNIVTSGSRQSQNGDYRTTSFTQSFGYVTSLDIESLIYDVTIQQADVSQVQVDCRNVLEGYAVDLDSDGTLSLYGDNINGHGIDSLSELIDFLEGSSKEDSMFNGELVITVPRDTILEECYIEGGTGSINLFGLTVDELDLDLGTGSFYGDGLKAYELSLDSGTGSINLTNVEFYDSDIDSGTGSVEISGRLLGDTTISCGIGRVDLRLADDQSTYSIDIEKGLGSLTINGKSYTGLSTENDGSSNSLDIEGGIGDINIDFGQNF